MKYFFFSIFLIVFISLIVVYINISSVDVEDTQKPFKPPIALKEEKTIVELLAKNKVKYLFPAKELYLKVDLSYVSRTTILYQTIINKLNKYQIFGIEQILDLNHIKYSIIKSKNDLQLFINFDKKAQAVKIQKLFDKYGFNVKLKRVLRKEKIKIKG